MQRQINQLSEQPAPVARPAATPKAADADAGEGGDAEYLKSDDFKEFEKEYPEVAKPMKQLVGGLQSRVKQARKELDAINKGQEQADVERHRALVIEQKALLVEEHSDWDKVIADEGFGPWLDEQPRHIQEAATRNAKEIVDAAQAADVIGRFKATLSAPSAATAADKLADTAAADKDAEAGEPTLTERRKRQLDSAASTRTGGPGAAHGIPEDGDEEAIWDAMQKKEERENRQRA
jgi:hypothetical protein